MLPLIVLPLKTPATKGPKIDLVDVSDIFQPITSFDGPFLGFKKSRSRGKDEKLRQKKAKMTKKTKH